MQTWHGNSESSNDVFADLLADLFGDLLADFFANFLPMRAALWD